jgi:molybdopterin converting factor small subunit
MRVPVLRLLGGLRRFGGGAQRVDGTSVAAVLANSLLPRALLFRDGQLDRDIEVLVNGRNIAFLAGLETPLAAEDRVTVFLHGARGYPGG